MKHSFTGPTARVQITVFDYSDTAAWAHEPPKFSVKSLPDTANRNTAFSKGDRLYYGTNFAEAWRLVLEYAPGAVLPPAMVKYQLRG